MTSKTKNIRHLFQGALQHHQAGSIKQAAQIYRQILPLDPKNSNVLHLLGLAELQMGNNEEAARLITEAISINPNESSYYNNLGIVLKKQGKYTEAVANCRQALVLKADNLEARINLGNCLKELGRLSEAVACYRKAILLKPDNAEAYNNLASILIVQGHLSEAADNCHKALEFKQDFAEAHTNLGIILSGQGYSNEAIACFQKALSINPAMAETHNSLGNAFKAQGRLDEAVGSFRNALSINRNLAGAYSNLLFTLNYLPRVSQEDIYMESMQWGRQYSDITVSENYDRGNSREKERCLKVGYVSPDFRTHSVAYFFEPLLNKHNRETVKVFCYANVVKADQTTRRMQAAADHWSSIVGRDDREIASQIRKDKIDILVDLAGHTAGNRLPLFAYGPAPIQLSWLGYPNTTGLPAMDYRLTDAIADPVGEADNLYSEMLVRLAPGFLCYQADASAPEVSSAPCLEREHITFGSFNDLAKTNPAVVKCWSEILRAVPGSHLIMKNRSFTDKNTQARYLKAFAEQGIPADRIELYGRLPKKKDHLAFYSRIDIGLDPFPYNGTTTTCEALWMGVAVVTLRGDRHAGRVGASIMHRIGLEELVAPSVEEYVRIAQEVAHDRKRLAGMRTMLRKRMQKSKLMDSQLFTRQLEYTYRQLWIKYCDNMSGR